MTVKGRLLDYHTIWWRTSSRWHVAIYWYARRINAKAERDVCQKKGRHCSKPWNSHVQIRSNQMQGGGSVVVSYTVPPCRTTVVLRRSTTNHSALLLQNSKIKVGQHRSEGPGERHAPEEHSSDYFTGELASCLSPLYSR